ncbi:MAG TPA: hypothetical protein VNY33_08660, partial [Gaiellaceae bacterium]|nr:hypothetical protein [Gaiellaceae bacterium]
IALVMALIITVVLIIVVASMISFTSAGSRNANVSNSQDTAQSLAEAGISDATSIINHAANAVTPTLLGCSVSGQNASNSALPCTDLSVTSVTGGTAYFHGMYTQSGGTGAWVITAYGDVTNPTGASDLQKTMSASLSVTPGGQGNNISVWNYVYSTAPQGAGCEVDISGNNVVVDVPVYITGDLCLSGNNVAVTENTANGGQPVDVRVGGKVVISGANATVGSAAHPITSGYSAQGCSSTIGGAPHPCTTADRWYVSNTDSPLTATPPTTDYPGWYTNASPGPSHICDPVLTPAPNLTAAGNQPHAFDNDGTMNGTNAQFNLTPGSDYNCVTANGTLDWNHTTHLLTINGTIFFDGNLTSTDSSAMYHGLGTLYVNGELILNGNNASLKAGCPASPAAATHQCAWGNVPPAEWNPSKDMLVIVTDKANAVSIDMSGQNVSYQGGLMCTPSSTASLAGNNVIVEGGVICGKYSWGNNTVIYPLPTVTNLPPGAPVPPNSPAVIGSPVITHGG